MTLLLALITIPWLMVRVESGVGVGGTDMQRHQAEDEEHGTVHVVRHTDPTAALNASRRTTPATLIQSPDHTTRPPRPAQTAPQQQSPRAVPLHSLEQISLRPADKSLTVDSYALPAYNPATLSSTLYNLTLFTTFSPTYTHIPSTFPLRTWTLLLHSTTHTTATASAATYLLVYTPDEPTCDYLTTVHGLARVQCVVLPFCFDDRSKRRRRKPNKGTVWWEADDDSRREGKMVCILKDVDRRAQTPFVGYFDHELLLTEDVILALHTVINSRVRTRTSPTAALTTADVAAIRKEPFMLIGRTWEVDTSSRPRMSWKRQGDDASTQRKKRAAKEQVVAEEAEDDYQERLASNRERLHDWLSDARAASILSQREYSSTFPMAGDVELFAWHNTHPLHWFIYPRDSLAMHAISKSSYMNDEDRKHESQEEDDEGQVREDEIGLEHGWESFVVWSAKSKARPPLQLIDVSDAVHVMHSHATSAHNHSSHAPPPSLIVFPDGANASEIARIIAAGNPMPSNPIAVPLSPANARQRLRCNSALSSDACELISRSDAELDALLVSRASADKQIILLMVNTEYLPLAYNWLCRARELSITSYLFIAEDRIAYFSLLSRNIPVILVNYARHRKRTAFTNTNSSWLFDETSYYRSIILQRAHHTHNLSVLLLHLDLVLFDNPLPLLLPNPHHCDVLVPLNGTFPSGGLFYFPQTALATRLVGGMVGCEEENVQFAHVYGGNRFVFSDEKEATCLYQLAMRLTTRYQFRRCTFDPLSFPSETDFFVLSKPQRVGVWPTVVHVEQQKTVVGKERVMKEWRMWRWMGQDVDGDEWMNGNSTTRRDREDERLLHPTALQWRRQRAEQWAARGEDVATAAFVACHPTPDEVDAQLLPEADDEPSSHAVHLHLLARGDDTQLSATIASLKAVITASTLAVHLHIDLSAPSAVSNARSNAANVSHLLLALETMQWKHGHKYVRSIKQPATMNADWIRSWTEVKQSTANATITHLNATVLCLTMQAGQLISPHAFVLLASLLSTHSLHLDTHFLSIALLHHPHILGETPAWRYGSRVVTSVVSDKVSAFLYQLSSLSGSVFFLSTVVRLLRFYDDHMATMTLLSHSALPANVTLWPSTFPCVPSLASNRWYLSQPDSNFDQYLHRFSFDHGLYSLHFNLRGSQSIGRLATRNQLCTAANSPSEECATPLVLLMDDPAQVGVSTRVALLGEFVESSLFPSLLRMPLYDFQFGSVEVELSVLARRSSMSAAHNPFDRTLGTAADDPAAEAEIVSRLVSEEVEDEDELDELAVPFVPGQAGTAAQEVVKEKVKRRVDVTEQQNINALIRTLVVADQHTRKQPVPAASNPHALIYPGSLQDRCFVLGSASDVWQDEEDAEMHIRPYIPPSTHPAYLGMIAYHQHIVRTYSTPLSSAATAKDARVLVYQPDVADIVPLDRSLRGLYFAFVLSLCLERMLIIDMAALRGVYNSPTNQTWLHSAYEAKLRHLPFQVFNATHASMLRSANLTQHFTAPVVYYRDLITHDRSLLSNPLYRWLPLSLFNSQSRVERTGQIMRYLLSRPSPVLVREAAALIDVLHLRQQGTTKAVVAVRLDFAEDVPLATTGEPLPNVTSHYLRCVQSMLSTLTTHPNTTRILFTTNRPNRLTYDAMSRILLPYGAVVTYADELKRLKAKLGRLLAGSGGGVESGSSVVTLSAEVLIGYVLAELGMVVVSDTTFGLFYTARNGFDSGRQYTVLVTEEAKAVGGAVEGGGGYCGPVRRLDRPKRMDVVY